MNRLIQDVDWYQTAFLQFAPFMALQYVIPKDFGLGETPAFAGQTADRPIRFRERSHEFSVPRERRG